MNGEYKQLLTILLLVLSTLWVNINQKPLHEQKEIFEKEYEEWRRNIEQIWDLMVVGIRLTKV